MAEVNNTNHKSTTFTIENGILKSYQWDRSSIVQIPSGVIEISANVFNGRTQIKMVEIPEGVTKIGAYAFKGCTALTRVKLPSTLKIISRYAFDGCGCLNKVVLPTNLEKIEEMAFRGCWSMDNLVIPDNVMVIGDWAFSGCYGIKNITLGHSLKHIGTNAFEFCTGVQEVTNKSAFDIKKGSTSYGGVAKYAKKVVALSSSNEQAEIIGEEELIQKYLNASQVASIQQTSGGVASEFEICKGVLVKYIGNGGEVDIPTNVTAIGKSAFKNSLITSVNIPYTVTTIGESAFHDCHKLAKVTIGQSVKTIGDYAFINCSSLTTIEIPNSVMEIGISAFSSCSSLSILIIGKSVTKIDDGAFSNCRSLSSVNVPDSVKFIGQHAFQSCEGLKSIVIGKEVTEIRDYAFYLCKNLSYVKNRSKLLFKANTDAYGGITKYASEVINEQVPGFVIENGVLLKYIGRSIDVEIPKIVNTIEKNAFRGCSFIYMITIPKSVTTIEPYAFKDCKLSKVNYLGSVEEWCTKMSISRYSGLFDDSPNLYFNGRIEDPLDIPYGITTIPAFCFSGCASITSVNIPRTVTTIQSCAFTRCQNLNRITVDKNNVNYKSLDGNLYTKDGQTLIQYAIGKKESSFTIPSTVTTIGEEAFYSCKALSSITIPKSVTMIGMRAFRECENLKSVYNLSQLNVIKGSISNGCVAKYATQVCTEIPKIPSSPIEPTPKIIPFNPDFEIEDGVLLKYIGKSANVDIPNTVRIIGERAFYNYYILTNVTIPDFVTSIKNWAFYECFSLQSITIPKTVKNVGAFAFSGCKTLSSITIPNSVTSIGIGPCARCTQLNQINVEEGNHRYCSKNGNLYTKYGNALIQYAIGKKDVSFTIPSSVKIIEGWAFAGCTSLKNITIPNAVTRIDGSAFSDCTSLQSISIPGSVTNIGNGICAKCSQLNQINVEESNENYISIDGNLYTKDGKTLIQYAVGKKDTSFTIPNFVTSIGYEAFCGCTSLASITIPSSITSIDNYAFSGCKSLKTVYNLSKLDFQKGAETHGRVAYYADNVYTELPKPVLPKTEVPKPQTYTYPDFVIKEGVLVKYKGAADKVEIPPIVTEIESKVFEKNSKLVSVTIADSVKRIGARAFDKCTSLKEVDLGGGVRYIGEYAFARCTAIEEITFPVSLMEIEKGAFERCSSLEEINNHSFIQLVDNQGTPDSDIFRKVDDDIMAFEENNYLANLVINDNVVTKYEEIKKHSEIALPKGVKAIGSEAFADNDTLEEIHTPDSLVEIGYRAFENCSKLRKVVLGSELERIAMRAFTKCASLDAIELPNTLTTIASWSFDDCTSLKEIVIPASVTVIEDGTFYGCTSLEKVTFLGKVQSIGAYAFDGCVALKEINLPKDCNIDDTAFNDCTQLN